MIDSLIAIISGVTGFITGILGVIFSLYRSKRDVYDSVNEFLTQIESKEFISAKNYVYNHRDKDWDEKDENAAIIVNFFHHWGMLANKKYLPMWVFKNATGNGACRLYELLKPYIELRREINNDEYYGEYFEWLYFKLKSKNISKKIN